jgi:hypothetical protein
VVVRGSYAASAREGDRSSKIADPNLSGEVLDTSGSTTHAVCMTAPSQPIRARTCMSSRDNLKTHKPNKNRWLPASGPGALPQHADQGVVVEPGGNLILDPRSPLAASCVTTCGCLRERSPQPTLTRSSRGNIDLHRLSSRWPGVRHSGANDALARYEHRCGSGLNVAREGLLRQALLLRIRIQYWIL